MTDHFARDIHEMERFELRPTRDEVDIGQLRSLWTESSRRSFHFARSEGRNSATFLPSWNSSVVGRVGCTDLGHVRGGPPLGILECNDGPGV